MALIKEWVSRIEFWKKQLQDRIYTPVEDVTFTYAKTNTFLRPDEVQNLDFEPISQGDKWGDKYGYGWFKATVTLPEKTKKDIQYIINTACGAEGLVYIDNKLISAADGYHRYAAFPNPEDGKQYEVLVEAFAGYGDSRPVLGRTTIGEFNEAVFQLFADVEVLYKLRNNTNNDLMRVDEIDDGLKEFTRIVDFEVDYDEFIESVHKAREALAPLMACTNGTTSPTVFAVGQSHLDVCWLWTIEETMRKCGRTFSNQLSLIDKYKDYKYTQSQAYLYKLAKELYPETYDRVKKAVADGQWLPEGGAWIEPDTNITGGESLIRQFVYGKRFFKDEFGVDNQLLWLPDCFGFSGVMPQIMRGCGIKYFATGKLEETYQNSADQFPYRVFTWEGIDGSEVLSCNYTAIDPSNVVTAWRKRSELNGQKTMMARFGAGDGGGGATRTDIEYLRRSRDLEGAPRTKMSTPIEFFQDAETRNITAKYVGELYYPAHRGTYTAQAKIKQGNNYCEKALREAEFLSAVASVTNGYSYPYEKLDELWEILLVIHFHDILPGTSIKEVNVKARADLKYVLDSANELIQKAKQSLSSQNGAAVFNSLSWDREEIVKLPENCKPVDGIPCQDGYAMVKIPAMGYSDLSSATCAVEDGMCINGNPYVLENKYIRIEFNGNGEIVSAFDKESKLDLCNGVMNQFRMYKDVPSRFDAWEIERYYQESPVELDSKAEISLIAEGELYKSILIKKTVNKSTLSQVVTLKANSKRLDFDTTVDWKETHKLLKVSFQTNIHTNEAMHGLQFGCIKRPTHASRPHDADRFEVPMHKWSALAEPNRGIAVMSNCKYGISTTASELNLTLLKSSMHPDPDADKDVHNFTYSFTFWNGSFNDSDIIRSAYELNYPVSCEAGSAGNMSWFNVDAENVLIETVKLAEDRSGDIIVRLYEAKGNTTFCNLTTAFNVKSITETNMLEEETGTVEYNNGLTLKFKPFEIKTLRIKK